MGMIGKGSKQNDDFTTTNSDSNHPAYKKKKWWRIASFRLLVAVFVIASLVNLNWPTSNELNAGWQAGQATHFFHTAPEIDSNENITAIIGGFPKRYIYGIKQQTETTEYRQWFSWQALIIDIVVCGIVIAMVVYQSWLTRSHGQRRLSLLDIAVVMSLLALFSAWSVERKAVFQFNDDWAKVTDSVPQYGTTRIWIANSLVTSWPLPTNWLNYSYIDAEETINCATTNASHTLRTKVKNPFVERICVLGQETASRSEKWSTLNKPPDRDHLKLSPDPAFREKVFPLLRTLELTNCWVDVGLLEWIKLHPNLRALRFVNCNLDPIPNDFFQSLPHLLQFEYYPFEQRDAIDLGQVAQCRHLQLLGLSYSAFERVDEKLRGHPGLREIAISADLAAVSPPTSPSNILRQASEVSGEWSGGYYLNDDVQYFPRSNRNGDDFSRIKLSHLPRLEVLSLDYLSNLSITLDSLPLIQKVAPWKPSDRFFKLSDGANRISCIRSSITNCPNLKWNARLDFGPSSVHRVDTIRSGDELSLCMTRLDYEGSRKLDSQYNSEVITRLDEFLARLPKHVDGGKLSLFGERIERLTPQIPTGLRGLTLQWEPDQDDFGDNVSRAPTRASVSSQLNWPPLSAEQLASLESFESNAVLSSESVDRILDLAPNLKRLCVNIDTPQLVIRDRPNLMEFRIYSVNGVLPADQFYWLGTPGNIGPFFADPYPCQIQFINCPSLQEIAISAMEQATIDLIDLPSLLATSIVDYGNNLNALISITGPTRLERTQFEFGKLCGTIEENCRECNSLKVVHLIGNFASDDIRAFVSQHRETLESLTFSSRRFDASLNNYLRTMTNLKTNWINGSIDAASFAKLHADKCMDGNEFWSVTMPTANDLAANGFKQQQKIQIDKFVIDNYRIEDDAAQWIADNVQTHELDVSQYPGDIEMLLPVVASDVCRLYISDIQLSDPTLLNAFKKYPKLIIKRAETRKAKRS